MDSDPMIHFIYLGNLLIEKGPLVLLDACQLLHDQGTPFHCHIVGAPTAEITLESMMNKVRDHKLSDCVTLHGAQYGNEKEKLLQQADVMVFPTFYHNECFPLVLLEGMRHSLVPISTREGAIPDIIIDGETGLLIDQQSPVSLASAMAHLINAPDRLQQMATAAHLRYKQHFTKEQFLRHIQHILREN